MALKWMKKGEDSVALAKQEELAAEKRKEEQGKMFRFWIKEGEDARITFVDGELSAEGFLMPPRYYEHNLFLNGSWGNIFVCPEKTNPESGDKCPICAGGDRPALVALFTIIDHREFKGKNDVLHRDTPKLLVAKSATFELLNKIALKRGGLAGCSFDVSRMGDKAASVGSMFDFIEKHEDLDALKKEFVRKVKDDKGKETGEIVTVFKPADYETEIVYRTADELLSMGFGKGGLGGAPKGNTQSSTQPTTGEKADYSNQL
jgi:hypothetical protein